MILERIEFKNFKRYSYQEIEFHDGITGIIGNNGTGKSTIVQGILFALYGVRAGVEGDFINSSSSGSKDKCSVTLDFLKDGSNYSITRWYRKTPSSAQHDAQLKINGKLLADSVSHVEKEIERVVGMQASDFRNTIYAGQKDLSSLLDDSPAERQKWFMKMLGIDFLKKEADAGIKSLIDECKTKITGLENYFEEKSGEDLPGIREATANELKEADFSFIELKEKIGRREEKEDELKKIAESLSEKWKVYRELGNETGLLKEANRQKSGYVSTLNEKLRGYEELLPEFEVPESSEKNYPGQKIRYLEYKDKEKSHSEISSALENLRYKYDTEKRRLEELETRLASFDNDKKRREIIIPEISKRERLLEDYEKIRQSEEEFRQLDSERIRVQEKLKQYREHATVLRRDIEAGEARLDEIGRPEDLEPAIRQHEENEKRLSGETIALAESVKTLERECGKLSKELDGITSLGEDGECPTCKRRLGEQYGILENSLKAGIRSKSVESGDLKEKIRGIEIEKGKIRSELDSLKKVKKESDKIASLLESKKKERQDLYTRVKDLIDEESSINEEISKNSFSEKAVREIESSIKSTDAIFYEFRGIDDRLKEERLVVSRKEEISGTLSEISAQIGEKRGQLSETGFDAQKFRELEEVFNEAEIIHQRYLELKPKIEQIPVLKTEISKHEEEMKINLEKIAATESSMKSMEISGETVDAALADVAECRKEINELKIEKTKLEENTRYLKKEIERIDRELAEIGERQKRYSELQERMVVLEKTRSLMKDYIIYLLNVIRAKIEGEVGRVLSEITDGRYESVLIDENFDILVNDLGENFPARRFSGGEQDDIAIALRIALSRYLAEMHNINGGTFMIFDEIFGSQDEERRSNLISALRTQESHFPQIFLISHISEIQGEFSTSLLVKTKDDWSSEVVEVSG